MFTTQRFVKLFDIKLICVLALVVFFMSGSAYGVEPEKGPSQYIVLSSHAGKHLAGQSVTISGLHFNSNNDMLEDAITIKYFDTKTVRENVDEIHSNIVYSKNGSFSDSGFIPPKHGIYLVVAESESGADGKLQIRAVDFTSTMSFVILIMPIAAIIILLALMSLIKKEKSKITISFYHVSRFSLISIIALGMVSFFIFSDIEYGVDSPVGIVINEHIPSDDGKDKSTGIDEALKLDWALHIGGHSKDNYSTGLKIPIYVLIFGVFGGYLRFFYFTANPWLKTEMVNRQLTGTKEKIRGETVTDRLVKFRLIMEDAFEGIFHPTLGRVLINRVMSDLSLLFIAPVLAVMMYFVLSQAGLEESENVWTFAVTSFAAGLFTENVITKLSEMGKKGKKTDNNNN